MFSIEVGNCEHTECEHEENRFITSGSWFYLGDIRDSSSGIDIIEVSRELLGVPCSIVLSMGSGSDLFEECLINIILQRLSLLIIETHSLAARWVGIVEFSSCWTADTYCIDGDMFLTRFIEGYAWVDPNIGSPIGHEDDRVWVCESREGHISQEERISDIGS